MRIYDDDELDYYYYNRETGESTWERPFQKKSDVVGDKHMADVSDLEVSRQDQKVDTEVSAVTDDANRTLGSGIPYDSDGIGHVLSDAESPPVVGLVEDARERTTSISSPSKQRRDSKFHDFEEQEKEQERLYIQAHQGQADDESEAPSIASPAREEAKGDEDLAVEGSDNVMVSIASEEIKKTQTEEEICDLNVRMATPGDLEKAEYDGNALEAQHSLVDAKAEAKQDIDSHVNHTAAVSPAVKNCVALAKANSGEIRPFTRRKW